MNEDEAILTEASEIWWRESDGCGPVTDAEGEGDEGLFGAPDTGWQYMTIDFRGYLVSPDGETVIAVSELDPEDVDLSRLRRQSDDAALARFQRELAEDIVKVLREQPKVPFSEAITGQLIGTIRERLTAIDLALPPGPTITIKEQTEQDIFQRVIHWDVTYPPTITIDATIDVPDEPALCGLTPTEAAALEDELESEFPAEVSKFEEAVFKIKALVDSPELRDRIKELQRHGIGKITNDKEPS